MFTTPALHARREIRGDRAQLSPDGSSLPPPYGLGEILFGGGGT
ncbi:MULTISPECIES: hypothetical protein [Paenibacillus]|uniref:Uncharacterized protein n=1 Tax=Paenibacillus brasilensis TaxID=128574 RepID=A0ABU0KX36_9BACL|nr:MULTISPECIES: hypothetical protein [Paenibacillus]MDQ0493965.1 hypothetical protein [Paenibacillus brasilensis]